MKKLFIYLFAILFIAGIGVSCESKEPSVNKPNTNGDINPVSQFVYDGLSSFYLWTDYMIDKKPTKNDDNPEDYFSSLLYKPTDKWSWITDDVDELLADFEGEAMYAFGFTPLALWSDDSQQYIIGFVRYVYPNTPAQEVGLKRGEIITHIDGQKITLANYTKLFGATSKTTFTVRDQNFENPRSIEITPRAVSTDPVLYYNVYDDIDENKTIGYLFYTGFISNYNNSLYAAFQHFKEQGVTDLVLDLRYNPGGSIGAAGYLMSLIAPKKDVENKSVFTIMGYNTYVNAAYDANGWERTSRLGSYNSTTEQNPLNANLDLDKVYIIATGSSASASELTTFCLRPFMEVVHIGQKTSGKYTASWTVHAYDSYNGKCQPVYKAESLNSVAKTKLKNWAMQPIVGRYTDKDGNDFVADGTLIPNHPIESQENNTKTWTPIGDPDDYLFAKAISLITGKPYDETRFRSATAMGVESGLKSQQEERISRAVLLDNLRPIEK